jgi:hypothetical protein
MSAVVYSKTFELCFSGYSALTAHCYTDQNIPHCKFYTTTAKLNHFQFSLALIDLVDMFKEIR